MRLLTTRQIARLPLCGVLALIVATTGCHVEQPYAPTPSTAAGQALDELKSLPPFEATKAQLEDALTKITTLATQYVPGVVWQSADNAEGSSCSAPYEQTGGKAAYLANRVAENVTVSESDWERLLDIVKNAATAVGAAEVQVMQDQPGRHDVWFTGPAGMFVKFSYKGNMVVSAYTGCRLP
ncbi:LppA family lipoprotein [Mycolicibacterium sp. CBM1]